jgi:DNA invertase Pin-like site-specific DNA recombinase
VATFTDTGANSEAYSRFRESSTNTPHFATKNTISKRRAALYSRISTKQKDQNPENQLLKLREFSRNRNFEVYDEYIDTASGANWDRPQLRRLMEDARHRKFDAIIVTKLDRFGRSVIDLEQSVRSLSDWGIDFVCVDQPIDTTIPTGKLLFTILAAISQFERELIRDRVKDGLERARKEGKRIGRPPILTDEIIGQIEERYAELGSISKVAKSLKLSRTTIWRALHTERSESGPVQKLRGESE